MEKLWELLTGDDDRGIVEDQPSAHPQIVIDKISELIDSLRSIKVVEGVVAEGFIKAAEETLGLGAFVEDCDCYLNQIHVRTDGILGECFVDSFEKTGEEVREVSFDEPHDILDEFDHPFDMHIFIVSLTSRLFEPRYQVGPGLPGKRFQHAVPLLKPVITQLFNHC